MKQFFHHPPHIGRINKGKTQFLGTSVKNTWFILTLAGVSPAIYRFILTSSGVSPAIFNISRGFPSYLKVCSKLPPQLDWPEFPWFARLTSPLTLFHYVFKILRSADISPVECTSTKTMHAMGNTRWAACKLVKLVCKPFVNMFELQTTTNNANTTLCKGVIFAIFAFLGSTWNE